MTIQCGITLLRTKYRTRYDREFPFTDDNIFDVLEHYDMPPVRRMDDDQVEFVLSELHRVVLAIAHFDMLDGREVTGHG